MPGRAALRFLLEVVFIVAVAAVAAASSLSVVGIVLVMVAAWLVVAGVEWVTGRSGSEPRAGGLRLRPRRTEAPAPPDLQPAAATAGEPHHVRVLGREQEPTPAAEPPVRDSGPVEGVPGEPGGAPGGTAPEVAPASVQESGVPPDAPVQSEPEPSVEPEPPPAPAPAPILEPLPAAPVLEVVAEPQPEPERAPEPEPAPAASSAAVRTLPLRGPQQWNLWDLERLAREHSGRDMFRDEERTYLLMYLREFANADGILPADFDGLVRDSFGDLVGVS